MNKSHNTRCKLAATGRALIILSLILSAWVVPLVASTPSPGTATVLAEVRALIDRATAGSDSTEDTSRTAAIEHNRFVDRYNEAVQLYNLGLFQRAAEILEAGIPVPRVAKLTKLPPR